MLLIDADILVYRAISSIEHEVEFEPDLWVMWSDEEEAMKAFDEMLEQARSKMPFTEYMLCFSDRENFRKEVDPTYKANRAKTRKPMGFKSFRESVMAAHPHVIKPKLEADDVIGILATKPGNDAVILSADKDLKQIPGKHLVGDEIITITPHQGRMLHMTQTLTGDPVDGYPGCPGIGKVKAADILSSMAAQEDPWDFVLGAYKKAGLTEEDALRQARLARILQWHDWDQQKQEVILWSPTKSN